MQGLHSIEAAPHRSRVLVDRGGHGRISTPLLVEVREAVPETALKLETSLCVLVLLTQDMVSRARQGIGRVPACTVLGLGLAVALWFLCAPL